MRESKGPSPLEWWVTSDTHFGHKKIIDYCNRPYKNTDQMNADIVDNINQYVKSGHLLYILGDVGFCGVDERVEILKGISGQKYLIAGNHDKALARKKEFKDQFVWIKDIHEMTVNGQRMIMCHYPMLSWNHMGAGSWMLHGHCHGGLNPVHDVPNRIDVGWDSVHRPMNYWSLVGYRLGTIRIIGDRKLTTVDYHDGGE